MAKSFAELLIGKTAKECADFKASQSVLSSRRGVFNYENLTYEILEMNKIECGVEVFVKAWRNGKQLSFAEQVEIERVRIFNPPLMIPDGITTLRLSEISPGVTWEIQLQKFKEDPAEALQQALARTIALIAKDEPFVQGKTGRTTSTFFAHTGDGRIGFDPSATWAGAHDAADGNQTDFTSATMTAPYSGKPSGADFAIYRLITNFDTSAIPDTDTVSAATLSYWFNSTSDGDNDANAYIGVVTNTSASDTAPAAADYDQFGATEQHDTAQRKDITGITTGAYTDFTLNATGRGNISKTGYSKFGIREGHDIQNDPYSGANSTFSGVNTTLAEQAGTTSDPQLVVVHGAAATPVVQSNLALLGVG